MNNGNERDEGERTEAGRSANGTEEVSQNRAEGLYELLEPMGADNDNCLDPMEYASQLKEKGLSMVEIYKKLTSPETHCHPPIKILSDQGMRRMICSVFSPPSPSYDDYDSMLDFAQWFLEREYLLEREYAYVEDEETFYRSTATDVEWEEILELDIANKIRESGVHDQRVINQVLDHIRNCVGCEKQGSFGPR